MDMVVHPGMWELRRQRIMTRTKRKNTAQDCRSQGLREISHILVRLYRTCRTWNSSAVSFYNSFQRNSNELRFRPKETATEDAIAAREDSRQQYRSELRSHKAEIRHLEDEIAPRAEPGTRERQLEKRREAAAANRAFADARGGSPEAAPDAELMGDNDFASLKREKEREQRKKNEREIRREEIMRARAAEREERVQKYREKEEETIGWLQALAKQRFG